MQHWEEIALSLLKKYTERYYTFRKRQWEEPHLEYRHLDSNDSNFFEDYHVMIERSQEEVVHKLEELRDCIQSGVLKPWTVKGLREIQFSQHLYRPLLYLNSGQIQITPVPLNHGEKAGLLRI